MRDEAGFTLIEVVAVLAIVALLAGMVFPMLRPGATPAELDAYAMRVAALLKADRVSALRAGKPVMTALSARNRSVTSGAGHGVAMAPDGVTLDAVVAARCGGLRGGAGIVFFASGLSCGGVIKLSRAGQQAEIRVNWLTGGVEVVATGKS